MADSTESEGRDSRRRAGGGEGEWEMNERESERAQTPYSGLFGLPVTSRLQINPANWFVPQQGYQMTEGWRERGGEGGEAEYEMEKGICESCNESEMEGGGCPQC